MASRRGLLAPLADQLNAHPVLVTLAMTLIGAFAGVSVRYLNATGSVTGAEMAVWGAMGALLFCSVTVRAIFRNRRDGRSQVSD